MRKRLKAFTLVEMLIVMGIIIILMAVGIASGRFAIQRANKIEHQNAAENIYQALQAYYSDYREYPAKDASSETPATLIMGTTEDPEDSIAPYIDDFEGGSEATYAYRVDSSGQETLVCVTYGGVGDVNKGGIYCTGNGVGGSLISGAPSEKDIEYGSSLYDAAEDLFDNGCANWDPTAGFGTTPACTAIDYTAPVE